MPWRRWGSLGGPLGGGGGVRHDRGALMGWGFENQPEVGGKLAGVRTFVRDEIIPLETLAEDFRKPGGRDVFTRITAPLKEQVREQGLWAAHLPPDMGGMGFGQVKLGLMHEILGQCGYAPSVFGNNA